MKTKIFTYFIEIAGQLFRNTKKWPGFRDIEIIGQDSMLREAMSIISVSKVGDQDMSWAPHFSCVTCARLLDAWAKGSRCTPFAIPMVWKQPMEHVSDCYFCLTCITCVTAKSKHTVQ